LPAASQQGTAHPEFIQQLSPLALESLTLEQLLRFWAHPVRAFFQMRLRVNFRPEESDIPDAEPFILEGLSRYQLNQELLNALVDQQDVEKLSVTIVRQEHCPMARLARLSGKPSSLKCRSWQTG
jgi:exodeoxyribonuclease V gamma subunit